MRVEFANTYADALLRFAVILARQGGKWLLCRHRDRQTLEVPGGHREAGESIEEAAGRELREETGARQYSLQRICDYAVLDDGGRINFGALFLAEVLERGELSHEIAEVMEISYLPRDPVVWTYPQIQPALIREAQRRGCIEDPWERTDGTKRTV